MADENEGFTVIWKIKNFTYCLQKKLEPLSSPSFVVNSFSSTRWNLLLYPRGVEDDKDVSFYLHRKNDGPEKISLDYELSIISAEGIPTACVEVKDHSFTVHHGFGASEFISRKDIEKDRDVLLPDDILTVRCRMWYCGIEPSPKGCTLSTCIGVDKGTFNWPIRSFSSLRVNEERALSLESSSKDYPSMLLKMSLTGGYLRDRYVKIEISQTNAKRPSYVVLNVQVLSVYGKSLEIAEAEHFFEKKDDVQVWKFPPFITKEKLIGKRSTYLPGDVLTLKCNCVLSVGVESEEIEYDDPETICDQTSIESLPYATSTHNIEQYKQRRRRLQNAQMAFPDRPDFSEVSQGFRSDLQSMYQDRILPDITLRACGKTFPVHKALLSARSPVFKAMFSTDMREHDAEFIEIPDLESETVHRFLLYMYTDTTEENLDWSAVAKLYFASDKYEVLPLQQKCSEFLKRSLFPGNALEILEIADMHHDDDLKSCVLQFILMNDHLIIGSDEWKKFEISNPGFAYETIRDIYLMKLGLQTRPELR
ncbi:BTB and MATH domain-containing protein 43 [Araneus ventricosus]|uniref:BTB and MATH domain-containing protein 43 n=1 Tax=Araneus ventricosus TaxID=182803 RepID=A0A4Y2MV56_ARAVE|nr:BTB and MATH domain-containing protein 43 [Araneus ventricosus]